MVSSQTSGAPSTQTREKFATLRPKQNLFFVQKTLAGKSYYEVVHQKPNQGEYFDFSFYSHPREGYNKKMYVCKSEGYIKLWSVLLNECSADKESLLKNI